MRHIYNDKIVIWGNPKEILKAKKELDWVDETILKSESEARLEIQKLIDEKKLKASIMYDGNSIWSFDRIIRNVKRIRKKGILGYAKYIPIGSMLKVPEYSEMRKPILSDYFYDFLHLDCGSIAHFSKAGWIAEYHSSDDLKKFFQCNEFGERVYDFLPDLKTDAKRIVEEIERILK